MAFPGFPPATHYIPVPSPLFGPILQGMDDLAELKCTLRAIWLLHHRKGYPRVLPLSVLASDSVLVSGTGDSLAEDIRRAMEAAVHRGTFLATQVGPPGQEEPAYLLNTDSNRKSLNTSAGRWPREKAAPAAAPATDERPNIFSLYEDNIGVLTPLLADQLREAEGSFPAQWVEDAFKLAVEGNHRSWRYIARILERWAAEGKDHGKPGRHTEANSRQRYLADYLRRRDSAC